MNIGIIVIVMISGSDCYKHYSHIKGNEKILNRNTELLDIKSTTDKKSENSAVQRNSLALTKIAKAVLMLDGLANKSVNAARQTNSGIYF